MSKFIEARPNVFVNVDHIIWAGYTRTEDGMEFTLRLSGNFSVSVLDIDKIQSIKKLLTNQPDQSTIKTNQDSNQPEKGKKNAL